MATRKKTTKTKTTTPKAPAKTKTTATKAKTPKTTKRVRSTKTVAPKTITTTPTRDAIARQAYLLFEARGFEHGHDVEDWLVAEATLRGPV